MNNITPVDVTPPINCSNFGFLTQNGVKITGPTGDTKTIPAGAQEFISVPDVPSASFGTEERFTKSKVAFSLLGMGTPEDIVITWA